MKLNVSVKMRITPADITSDLEAVKEKLSHIVEKYGRVYIAEIKPIAFGLKSLETLLLLDDSVGGIDEIEKELKKLKDVSQVDILEITRI